MFHDHKDTYRPPKETDNSNSYDENYLCKICGKTFMTEVDMEYHRKCDHWSFLSVLLDNPDKHMCWICFRRQKNKETLSDHVRIHHFYSSPKAKTIEHDIYICDCCNHIFYNKEKLANHIIHYHTSVEDKVDYMSCPKCNKTIASKRYWFHSIRHGLSSFTTCPICIVNCKNKSQLLKHIWDSHPYLLRCDICQYETKNRTSYENHLNEHNKKIPIRVVDVDKYFIFPRAPVKYVVDRWFGGLPLPRDVSVCILCREICKDTGERLRHIEVSHGNCVKEDKKVHMCQCGEEFFSAILLKHHLLKTKEYPEDHRVLSNEEIHERTSLIKSNNNCGNDVPCDSDLEEVNLVMEIQDS